jgi:glutathione peroxidase
MNLPATLLRSFLAHLRVFLLIVAGCALPSLALAADACPPVLNYTFNSLQTGKSESLCQYRGKVVLVVNTASYCGYTHQYEGLEALYRKYKASGLVVLGFPTNDFGGQEPGTNGEIAEFCRLTYGVQFPMFEKSSIKSIATNPLYSDLIARTGSAPKWNFHKYLIDRDGNPVASFASKVEPQSSEMTSAIEKLLAAPSAAHG